MHVNFESIHNYYESLVIERVMRTVAGDRRVEDAEFLQDVACVALNSLPARYVRYDVDMAFYLTSEERVRMDRDVERAVKEAVEQVRQHRRSRQDEPGPA